MNEERGRRLFIQVALSIYLAIHRIFSPIPYSTIKIFKNTIHFHKYWYHGRTESKTKKEIKTFESDKRIALKKIKGTSGKGKKGKEAMAKAEEEWGAKHKILLEKHAEQISELEGASASAGADGTGTSTSQATEEETKLNVEGDNAEEKPPQLTAKEKALAKKMRKRQNALAKQKAREEEIANEMANAPNPRQMEIDAIMELYLNKDNLVIEEVAADGNCLYRAIAKQMEYVDGDGSGSGMDRDYVEMRKICSEEFLNKREEYEPFADLEEMKVTSFEEYVEKVRESSEWGGHLELKALAHSLKKTIVVYSTEGALEIKGESSDGDSDENFLRLSFHRNYYTLGEHYNSVVPKQWKESIE